MILWGLINLSLLNEECLPLFNWTHEKTFRAPKEQEINELPNIDITITDTNW